MFCQQQWCDATFSLSLITLVQLERLADDKQGLSQALSKAADHERQQLFRGRRLRIPKCFTLQRRDGPRFLARRPSVCVCV